MKIDCTHVAHQLFAYNYVRVLTVHATQDKKPFISSGSPGTIARRSHSHFVHTQLHPVGCHAQSWETPQEYP